MKNKYFEISVGFFIIIGVLCLAFLAFKVSGSSISSINNNNYSIVAEFKNIGSLRKNAAVKIAGVEVGRVTNISLTKSYNGFMATVTLLITTKQQIPTSYNASIQMSGLLGDNFVGLSPAKENVLQIAGIDSDENENEYMSEGSIISLDNTESALDLGSLINTFVANKDESTN